MLGIIVNPMAGNGRGGIVWRQAETILRGRSVAYRVRKTTKMGEAENLAMELIQKEGVTKVIAVGGDGTVHEVINGIQKSGKPCLFGLIAAGSGNDFARGHRLPENPVQAVERILQGEEKQIDLLQINQRYSANVIGTGFDAEVAREANEAPYKRWFNQMKLGWFAYVVSLLRVALTYQPSDLTLVVDGAIYRLSRVWLVAVANIPNFGGGMRICPQAVPNDGKAEICVVSNVSRWQLLSAFPLIFSGRHGSHPGVRFYRGQMIEIDSARPLVVQADGEVVEKTPLTIHVIPECQRICG